MHYEGTIYRPPSEARSLLVQTTVGCSWNKCTFCDMYKDKQFRIRPLEDILADLQEAAPYRDQVHRVFLCDGDALVLPTDTLAAILAEISKRFPCAKGVRTYASAPNILRKTPDELSALAQAGLNMVYLGLESGSDQILAQVNKGVTRQQMIDAAQLLRGAGITQSTTIIAGLGGKEQSEEHILQTASALNCMQPEYLGMLTLYVGGESQFGYAGPAHGQFVVPTAHQVMEEMLLLLQHLQLKNCFFSSAHISNYINIKGNLPADRQRLIDTLAHALR